MSSQEKKTIRKIYFLLLLYLFANFSVTQAQAIEEQDFIQNKTIKSIRAYKVSDNNRILEEEKIYNEKGKVVKERMFKKGIATFTINSYYSDNGDLSSYKVQKGNHIEHGLVFHTYSEKFFSVDSLFSLFNEVPDSVAQIRHFNYSPDNKKLLQHSKLLRSGKYLTQIFEYDKEGRLVSNHLYELNDENPLPKSTKTTSYYDKDGKKHRVFRTTYPKEFEKDVTTYNFFDKKGRTTKTVHKSDHSNLTFKTKYNDSKNTKTVKNNHLNRTKTYTMDEFGNYVQMIIKNRIYSTEINYEYY